MRLRITIHAAREMVADDISTGDIEVVLTAGEAIRLVLAWVGGRPIHVVAAYNPADDEEIIDDLCHLQAGATGPRHDDRDLPARGHDRRHQ